MPLTPIVPESQDHPIVLCWKAMLTVIREDQGLQRVTKTMRLMEGEVDAWAPPSEGELPWLQVAPLQSPMRMGEVDAWECDFKIRYALAVNGTRAADLLNYFGLFISAITFQAQTQGTTALLYLRQNSARTYRIDQAAIGTGRLLPTDPLSTAMRSTIQIGTGIISVDLMFST